jgi:membrane protease YdiL (CAAX protease family)
MHAKEHDEPASLRLASKWWRAAVGASAVIVAYGNLATVATWLPYPGPLVPVIGHPLLVAATLVWARSAAGLTWADLGFSRSGWVRSTLLGLGLGGLMTLLVLVALLGFRAIGWSSATTYPQPEDPAAFAQVVLRLLLVTALCEELWFRGLLQACWGRLLPPRQAMLVGALLFAAWHLAVWAWTLERVTLTPALQFVLTYPVGLLILGIAGLLFSWLRRASGNLIGPIVAHWVIDVALVVLVLASWL